MYRPAFKTILVVAAFIFASATWAQRFKFDSFTADSGLASSFIFQIEQDDKGNIWFVTLDGLSRYDGREFINFGTDEGLLDGRTSALAMTPDDRYIIGSSSGVSVWDGRLVRNFTEADGLGHGNVWALAAEESGRVWIGTQAGGLSSLEGERIRTFTTDDGLPSNFIYALRLDKAGRLWIGTRDNGFAVAEIGDDGAPRILHAWTLADGISSPVVRAFNEEPEGTMLVGLRGGGVMRVDAEWNLQRVAPQLAGEDVYSIVPTNSGGIFIAIFGGGVRVCTPPLYNRCLNLDRSNGLSSNAVTSILEDREGGLWVGTASGALHLAGHDFVNYGEREGLSSDFGFAIVPDKDDSLWISSLAGLTRLYVATPSRPLRSTTLTVRDGLPTNEVWHVLRDRSDRLWIATAAGLCLYTEGRGCRTFGTEAGLPTRLIMSLHLDAGGRIWVGTRNGAARLKENVNASDTRITDLTALEGVEILAMEHTSDGALWFAGSNVVARFVDGKWSRWSGGAELGASLINEVLVTRDDSVWFGTNDEGLARYDADREAEGKPILQLFGKESGLPSLTIKSLVEDSSGMIWAGSNAGLLKLDPSKAGTPSFVVRQYTLDDGLASQEPTSQHAFARDHNGDLWLGFSGGVTQYLNLEEMGPAIPTVSAIVSISSVMAGAERIFAAPFTTMARKNGHRPGELVTAPLGERDLNISYSAAVFRGRRTVQYQVRLEGYDGDWSTPTGRTTKEYTKLPPGSYTFRVRSRLREGKWGPEASAPIIIPATFWETPWFRTLLAIVAVAILLTAHRARTLRIRRRNEELREIVADRTRALEERSHELEETNIELEHANIELDTINRLLKEADLAKSRFLARMSHELRTPLNSIIGFTDVMLDGSRTMDLEKRAKFLRNVRHSATILLGLINDILDLSKIEAGRMEVHIEKVVIADVVEEVVETMRVSADSRRSHLTTKIDPALNEVWVDIAKVRQILQNLISNAIKYSGDEARIQVAVSPTPPEVTGLGLEAFELAVSDNGKGIPAEQLPGIFDEYRRLRQDASQSSGTGLGLAIVSKFSELMGGKVGVESELGKGSTFRVWLPIDARHWDSEQSL